MKQFIHAVLYQPFYNLLIFFVWLIPGHSVGWAIVALTIVVRLVLLPTSIKAAYYQVKNLEMQPKMNKIRKEIKDPQEQNKAIMALFKAEGHSPLGSCLLPLIQLPLLLILYSVFRTGLSPASFSSIYSFIPHPGSINAIFLGFNLTAVDPWILPIVAGVTQLGLSLLMLPQNQKLTADEKKDPSLMMNKQMLFIGPVITVWFGHKIPSALTLYWIVTTLFSIGLQFYVNKMIKNKKIAQPIEAVQIESPQIEAPKEDQKLSAKEIYEQKKQETVLKLMGKRLDKQEKKSGVSVTVRTKK